MSSPKDSGLLRGGGGDVAASKVLAICADLQSQGFSRVPPFSIGKIEKRMEDYANAHGMDLPDEIYMTAHGSHSIAHAMRDEKAADGKTVSPTDLAQFARDRRSMDLYYDTKKKNFTYVDGKNKYILHPNEEIKTKNGKIKKVAFLTAQKLSPNELFNGRRYDKIE